MRAIRISDIQCRPAGEQAELSACIEGTGPVAKRLWFRFPAAAEGWLTRSAEPFMAALLPLAMLRNLPLRADGLASPLFLSNCRQIVTLYHAWDQRLRDIQVDAASQNSVRPSGNATGCFFTGGVDSFYTVLKNLERETGDQRITHLIFIRGYADCPLENEVLCANLAARLGATASALGLRLLTAETNLKSFSPAPAASWDWYAGSQLASVGLCLGRGFRRLCISGGDTYATLSKWGSHPIVDPLWSTEWLEFRHDGCEASRSQKLEWYVARSELALTHLRVCGYESSGLQNCGTCEKCLRTMIGLAALGVAVPHGLFARTLDLGLVRKLNGSDPVASYYLHDNLGLLAARRRYPELEAAVRAALNPTLLRRCRYRVEAAAREVDRRYLNGRLRAWALERSGSDAAKQSDLRMSPSWWVLREALRVAVTARSASSGPEQMKESAAAVQRRLP